MDYVTTDPAPEKLSACRNIAFRRALVFTVFLATSCGPTTSTDDDFRKFIYNNPEVVVQSLEHYQKIQADKATSIAEGYIKKNRKAVYLDNATYIINPNGKFNLVYIFDYNCAHCIGSYRKVLDLAFARTDIRLIIKDFPIFGEVSNRAAQVAYLIEKEKPGSYLSVFQQLMAAHPLDESKIRHVSRSFGLVEDRADLRQAFDSMIKENRSIASEIGVSGTPSFIIGDTVIVGEDMKMVCDKIAKVSGIPCGQSYSM